MADQTGAENEAEALRRAWVEMPDFPLTLRRLAPANGTVECGVCGGEGRHFRGGWAVTLGTLARAWRYVTVCDECLLRRAPHFWTALRLASAPSEVVESVVRGLRERDGGAEPS